MKNRKKLNNSQDISIAEILDRHVNILYNIIGDYITDLDIDDMQLYLHLNEKNGIYNDGITLKEAKSNKTTVIYLTDISVQALDNAITKSKIFMFDKIFNNKNKL